MNSFYSLLVCSTLLDLLSKRTKIGCWSGEIFINRKSLADVPVNYCAYVQQNDMHYPTLTVEETIMFSAWTRLANSPSKQSVENRVKYLLHSLGILDIKDRLVGDSLQRGISGGQLKCLSIAVEIVSFPDVIYLDEPTSGLDSFIALDIIQTLKQLAVKGSTCIATVHQPSYEIMKSFDRILLLSSGRVVYANTFDQLISYFTSYPLKYDVTVAKSYQNPADFALDICSKAISPLHSSRPLTAEELSSRYKDWESTKDGYDLVATTTKLELKVNIEELLSSSREPPQISTINKIQTFRLIVPFLVLLYRSSLITMRDKHELRANVLKNTLVGCIITLIFFDKANISPPFFNALGIPESEVFTTSALLYFMMTYSFICHAQIIPMICKSIIIYRRELTAGAYSSTAFFLAAILYQIPFIILAQTIFICFTYFSCGFPKEIAYFLYLYILLLLCNLAAFYIALCLAALTECAQISFSIFPLVFLFLCNFAGFSININNIPWGWSWAKYLSFARWSFEGLMVNEFSTFDNEKNKEYLEHDRKELADRLLPSLSNQETVTISSEGAKVLTLYGFEDFNKFDAFWIVSLFIGTMLVLIWISLLPKKSKLRKCESPITTEAALGTQKKKQTNGRSNVDSSFHRLEDALLASEFEIESGESGGKVSKRLKNQSKSYTWNTSPFVSFSYNPLTKEVDSKKLCLGYEIVFSNLSYEVRSQDRNKKKPLVVLDAVSGYANPGELLIVLGSSGSGKSTLLDILAHRKTIGKVCGHVLYDGHPVTKSMARHCAYVMQDNVHIGALNVKETLTFAAKLRMPGNSTYEERTNRVEEVIELLGLQDHADTIVGNHRKKGLSGGQIKRLTIGVEIMNSAHTIFLDEPTTGLDSTTSLEVLNVIRKLVQQNHTVISSMHQPSSAMFSLFDKIILLAEGRIVYFGPAENCADYFVSSPFQFLYFEKHSNPAEFILSVVSRYATTQNSHVVTASELAGYYSQSDLHRSNEDRINLVIDSLRNVSKSRSGWSVKSEKYHVDFPTSTVSQLLTLCHRELLGTYKDPRASLVTLLRYVYCLHSL